MGTYYKIIYLGHPFAKSFFADAFHINGLSDLWVGRHFCAAPEYTQTLPDFAIHAPYPVLHFSDNALDALFWRQLFGHVRYVFEIKPIGQIYRECCRDSNGLYQCGAREIELVKLITEDGLIDLARDEISENTDDAISRYPVPYIQNYIRRLLRGGR